jgi:hypothetical protein
MDTITKVPMVRGRNRLCGTGEGWIFDGDSAGYAALKQHIRAEVEATGCTFAPAAIELKIASIFGRARSDWEAKKDNTAGHVLEVPINGRRFLLGDERTLNRAPALPA